MPAIHNVRMMKVVHSLHPAIRALSALALSVPGRPQSLIEHFTTSLFTHTYTLSLYLSIYLSFCSVSRFLPSRLGIAPLLQPLCLLFKSANYRSRLVLPPPATNRGYLRSEIDRFELRICAGASHFHIQVPTSAAYHPRFLPLLPETARLVVPPLSWLARQAEHHSNPRWNPWEVSLSLSPRPLSITFSRLPSFSSSSLSPRFTLSLFHALSLSGPLIAFASSDVVRLPI